MEENDGPSRGRLHENGESQRHLAGGLDGHGSANEMPIANGNADGKPTKNKPESPPLASNF